MKKSMSYLKKECRKLEDIRYKRKLGITSIFLVVELQGYFFKICFLFFKNWKNVKKLERTIFFIFNVWSTICKGQLISKCLFGIFNLSQKTNEKILLYYYGTSSRIVFVRFLGELNTLKRHFEINWPLENFVWRWLRLLNFS